VKRGDLVKHPGGIRNVCEDMYGMGIVLAVHHPQNPPGETQVKVVWHGKQSILLYHESQLEVISESR